eukprot:scaffold508674_cov32-Prasinocladus_malaysianus.AAC.1
MNINDTSQIEFHPADNFTMVANNIFHAKRVYGCGWRHGQARRTPTCTGRSRDHGYMTSTRGQAGPPLS